MWPKLTNIDKKVYDEILANQEDTIYSSGLNVWMRVFSGAKNGLYIESNPNWGLLSAQNKDPDIKGSVTRPGLYGNTTNMIGSLGRDWDTRGVNVTGTQSMKPMPLITSISVKEGGDQLSRKASINMRVHSVEQLEMVQTYFMEPGFILFLEWGWNTYRGVSKAFKLKVKGKDGTLKNNIPNVPSFAGSRMLSSNISNIRKASYGNYDCFSGFIVGGSIQSSGEFYDVTVDLRGVPALPTYLQSQNLTYSAPETTTSGGVTTGNGFTPSEITDPNNSNGQIRFRKFYNSLPAQRQTDNVRKMTAASVDFINYDYRAAGLILNWQAGSGGKRGWWDLFRPETSFQKLEDQAKIDRKKVFSEHQYVIMNTFVKILNESGALTSYKLGDTEVKIKIQTKNTPIGAFPKMFSTKPEVMVLPGKLPDFSQYFLSDKAIDVSILETEIDNSIKGSNSKIEFVQYVNLNSDGLTEKAGYWGYLGNIYLNIKVIQKYMDQNIGIREMFLGILNECSSAVNSLWDFQVVEREIEENGKKTIVLSVYDENWIGKTDKSPRTFFHSGPKSVFLDANLSIDLPASMTNKIIGGRAGLSVDKDSTHIEAAATGSFFGNAGGDKFFSVGTQGLRQEASGSNDGLTLQQQLDNLIDLTGIAKEVKSATQPFWEYYDASGKFVGSRTIEGNGNTRYTGVATEASVKTFQEVDKKIKEIQAKIKEQKNENISTNIDKLDVVPNPEIYKINNTSGNEINYFTGYFSDDTITTAGSFRKFFRIYSYKDSALLDVLKNRMFNGVKGTGRLSTLLPIKYTFTILGNSGIQRGDMFNIIGLPERYRKCGLFQVTEVSHAIEGMQWKTTVTGMYRQQQ